MKDYYVLTQTDYTKPATVGPKVLLHRSYPNRLKYLVSHRTIASRPYRNPVGVTTTLGSRCD